MTNPINRSGPFSPFAPPTGGTGNFRSQELTMESVVVDVIINEQHQEYAKDGYNVGFIKFRSIKTDQYRQAGQLNWACPLDSNVTDYPLLNEIVHIYKSLNRFYYSKKINVSQRVTTHPLFGLNEELAPAETASGRSKSLSTFVNPKVDDAKAKQKLGKYFEDAEGVKRLRSDEGDVIFEGRSGHSIRFGAAWPIATKTIFHGTKKQAPNLIVRVGPDIHAAPSVVGPFGTVKEDINLDATSLYMVTDQIVPLEYSTRASAVHARSVTDFPSKLDGSQLVINTDRFVVNTKKGKIMGHSFLGIHWTTNKDFTVDAGQDYVSLIGRDTKVQIRRDESRVVARDRTFSVGRDWTSKIGNIFDASAGKRFSIVAPKVYVGLHEGMAQPIVCGAMIADFLQKFLDAFIQFAPMIIPKTSPPNLPSQLHPAVVQKLTQLKTDVAKGAKASFNSTIAYTTK